MLLMESTFRSTTVYVTPASASTRWDSCDEAYRAVGNQYVLWSKGFGV